MKKVKLHKLRGELNGVCGRVQLLHVSESEQVGNFNENSVC
jgi:hypothetical protein